MIAAPGSLPLTTANGAIVAGAVIRAVGHQPGRTASIPYRRMRSHQVVIGTTGTGKTTLLLRLWAGFMATALRRHAAGLGRPPLLVVLDCKGGADARRIADRARRVLRAAGARHAAIWPDEASLSLWTLPPPQLTTTLLDLIEHGAGAAAYYADVMEAVVALAVEAPCGPPVSAADFLSRLDPGWLSLAYSGGGHDGDLALVRSAARQFGDIALRFRTLFRRLGSGLDGPGGFADADAWYCILEGTAEISVAEGQARALVDLLASYAAGQQDGGGQAREILLAVDEFSAVSRRLPIWQLYERARSLGLAVQVSAQSWPGLAADEDERYRIAASADGGIWLLRTPYPEPVTALAGTRKLVDTTRRLLGVPVWGHQGTSRIRQAPVADPALIRSLDVGQTAYIYRGGVTFIQVKRLIGGPAGLAAALLPDGRPVRGRPVTGPMPQCRFPGGVLVRRLTRRRPVRTRPPAAGHRGTAGRGVRPGGRPVSARSRRRPDPFAALGLTARPDLTDDDVRMAWRRVAAATHPDRADGGDPERFAVAAAAYTELRTRFGRGEAMADARAGPGRPPPLAGPPWPGAFPPGVLPPAAPPLPARPHAGDRASCSPVPCCCCRPGSAGAAHGGSRSGYSPPLRPALPRSPWPDRSPPGRP